MNGMELGVIEILGRIARVSAVSHRQIAAEPEVRIEIRITCKKALTEQMALRIAKKYLRLPTTG